MIDELSELHHGHSVGDWLVSGTEHGGADEAGALQISAVGGQTNFLNPCTVVHVSESIFGSDSQMCSFTVAVIWRSNTAVGGGCLAQQRRFKVVARAINGAVLGSNASRNCQASIILRTQVSGPKRHQIFDAESMSVIFNISYMY